MQKKQRRDFKVQAIARKFACSSRCPAVQGRTALTFCWIRSHAKALSVSLSSRLSINQSIYLSIYLSFFLSPRDGGIPKDHCANQIHYKTGSKTPPWRLECKYRRENAVRKKAWREIHSDTEKKKEKKRIRILESQIIMRRRERPDRTGRLIQFEFQAALEKELHLLPSFYFLLFLLLLASHFSLCFSLFAARSRRDRD